MSYFGALRLAMAVAKRLNKAEDRDKLIAFLKERGIPVMVYYPIPLHQQKAYIRTEFKNENYPITMELCKSVISLPMHTELDENQLKYIIESVNEYFIK